VEEPEPEPEPLADPAELDELPWLVEVPPPWLLVEVDGDDTDGAEGVDTDGADGGVTVPAGVLTVGALAGGVVTVGVFTGGVLTAGVVTVGVETVGAGAGVVTVTEGTVTDGTVTDGTVTVGVVTVGTGVCAFAGSAVKPSAATTYVAPSHERRRCIRSPSSSSQKVQFPVRWGLNGQPGFRRVHAIST
jgi:hypothetical protein